MITERPNLLVVCDSPPNPDRMGSSRTLYNTLSRWNSEQIMICCWSDKFPGGADQFKCDSSNLLQIQRDPIRLPSRLAPFRSWLRKFYQYWYRRQIAKQGKFIRDFRPEIILFYTESIELYWVAIALSEEIGIPHVQYVMDDMLDPKQADIGIHRFHECAAGWIFISNALASVFSERWKILLNRHIEVHNPVTLISDTSACNDDESEFNIVYAGSIWPMHADALRVVADAVGQLRKNGVEIRLIVYTKEEMWISHSEFLNQSGCIYGGFKNEAQLIPCLAAADLLLVCSSFALSNKTIVKSSIQTKLSDYMAASKPIISIGPSYAICHDFVKQWECGYSFTHQDSATFAEFLSLKGQDREALRSRGVNGNIALRENFTIEVVDSRLCDFFEKILISNT